MFVGIKCVMGRNNPYQRWKVTPNECFECSKTSVCGMNVGYIYSVVKGIEHPHTFPSVTSCFSCARRSLLMHYYKIYLDPRQGYALFKGNAVHHYLEELKIPGAIQERRLSFKIGKYTLSGAIDLIIGDTMYDFKTRKYINEEDGKVDLKFLINQAYIYQLSLYQEACRQNKIKINKLFLEYYTTDSTSEIMMYRHHIKPKVKEAMLKAEETLDLFERARTHQELPSRDDCVVEFGHLCKRYCPVNNLCKKAGNVINNIRIEE